MNRVIQKIASTNNSLSSLPLRFGLGVITMLVALITVHGGAFFAPNAMEYPLILVLASITLIINGGGAWSIDQRITASE